jgi:flagellar hook-associated protein 1 FlgK
MSLIGALNVGKTALAIQQAAIQTTGNNIANAGNADYTRQTSNLSPNKDQQVKPGTFVGTGINLDSIQRQIDEALQTRLRGSTSDAQSADTTQQWLSRVEAVFNELSDQDLSTGLSTFFNSWSSLANKPQDIGLRQVVIQNGQSVASFFKNLRGQLGSLQKDAGDRLKAVAADADNLAQQVADLNAQIVQAEGGAGGSANGLRDQRDAVLKKLSELADIKTVPQDNGSVVDVYVGSEPLVIGTTNRGVGIRQDTDPTTGSVSSVVIFKANNGNMKLTSGQLGALSAMQAQIDGVSDNIDKLAGSLIFELNKIHSAGQGLQGFSTTTGTNAVDDTTLFLNDPRSGLKFTPTNGSFVVHVKNKTTGLTTSTLVKVDLDGLNNNDATLNSLAADIDGIANISAKVNAGKLTVSADSGDVEVSFSQDSSGVLAALGVNSFFTGSRAGDIAVNQNIVDDPTLLAAAKNGEKGDNQTAVAIAGLESTAVAALGGASMKDNYQAIVNGVSTSAASAKSNAEATQVVQQTLEAQRESLSGVSLDEEAINLMKQQRAFQGAARLITAVNDMMDQLMNMVR